MNRNTATCKKSSDELPRADAAEKYLVGVCLAYCDAAGEVFSRVRAGDFVDPALAAILGVLARQHASGGIDIPLAAAELNEHPAFPDGHVAGVLLELAASVATSAHVAGEAAKIVDARRKRQLFAIAEAAGEAALNGQSSGDVLRMLDGDLWEFRRECEATAPRDKFAFADLRREYPRLNSPVVDGLFRAGETCNIISTSKVGKSWLGYSLVLSIITGQPWLGRFNTAQGKVLLVDNELHRCTLAHRIPTVADAMGIPAAHYEGDLDVWPLRGNLRGLADLETDIEEIEAGEYRLILLDAMYRFAVEGVSENDNAAMAAFYNRLDRIAERTGAAVALIHHASKGSQSDKRLTDVGSGAGAQSRAADCHLVLREHEEPGVVVLEAAVRSFAPVQPLALRWVFPLWRPADDIDPSKLKGKGTANEEHRQAKDREGINATVKALMEGPASARTLRRRTGFGEYRQSRMLDLLIAQKQVAVTRIKEGAVTHETYALSD